MQRWSLTENRYLLAKVIIRQTKSLKKPFLLVLIINADKAYQKNRQTVLGVDFEHYLAEPSGIVQALLRFQLPS